MPIELDSPAHVQPVTPRASARPADEAIGSGAAISASEALAREEVEQLIAELEQREVDELDAMLRWSVRSSVLVVALKTLAAVVLAGNRGVPVTFAMLWRVIPSVQVGVTGTTFHDIVWTSTLTVILLAMAWAMIGLATAVVRDSWGLATGTFLAIPMAAVLVALEKFRFPDSGVTILSSLRLIGLGGFCTVLYVIFHPVLPRAEEFIDPATDHYQSKSIQSQPIQTQANQSQTTSTS